MARRTDLPILQRQYIECAAQTKRKTYIAVGLFSWCTWCTLFRTPAYVDQSNGERSYALLS